jgi:flagellar assembly protein FliH
MGINHLLEDFNGARKSGPEVYEFTEEEIEDIRLNAFDEGYRAGWDDGVKAQTAQREFVSEELRSRIQDLSFSYHEASRQMLAGLEPLLQCLVRKVLPEALHESAGPRLVETLLEAAGPHVKRPVVLSFPPGDRSVIAPALDQIAGLEILLEEDPSLEGGAAIVRLDDSEVLIEPEVLLAAFQTAIDAFFHHATKEAMNE